LGTKYSSSLNAEFKNKDGEKVPIEMGCFGIGVSRMLPAIVEASYDKDGIIWPESVAPFKYCVIPSTMDSSTIEGESILDMTEKVARVLAEKYGSNQVIMDDRDVSTGFKFKDSLLIGYPYTVVVGKDWINFGKLEVLERRSRQVTKLSLDEL
jgi:prolyl-tRNA synthetase